MSGVEIVGTVAAVCTTVSFVPQVYKIHRTKMTRDLSAPMYCIFTAGVFAWMVYGLLVGSRPVIWANLVTLALCAYILVMKIRHT